MNCYIKKGLLHVRTNFQKFKTQAESADTIEYITGAAQPKLIQSSLKSIRIPVPPISKQKQIIERLDGLLNQTKALNAI